MNIARRGALALMAVVALSMADLPAAPPTAWAEDITLRMAVPDWPPTRIMKDLADKGYKAPSGNKVTLEPDFIPWPNYYERLAASLTSGEKKYQMAVSDSQWLGAFVEGGYYLKLNKYIDADPALQAIFKDLHPNLVNAYSTYPVQVEELLRFPADARRPHHLLSQGRLLPCRRAAGLPVQVRLQAAVLADRR